MLRKFNTINLTTLSLNHATRVKKDAQRNLHKKNEESSMITFGDLLFLKHNCGLMDTL